MNLTLELIGSLWRHEGQLSLVTDVELFTARAWMYDLEAIDRGSYRVDWECIEEDPSWERVS